MSYELSSPERIGSDLLLCHNVSKAMMVFMETLIDTQLVVVKDFMGRAFVRKVWTTVGNSVFITSESGHKRLSSGEKTPWPIGVPIQDVYEYDGRELPKKVNWKRMTNWTLK
jgi:hypothetical protein